MQSVKLSTGLSVKLPIVLLALSGCSVQSPCPPPELIKPVIPASLLKPPPTDQEWDLMLQVAIETLTHQGSTE